MPRDIALADSPWRVGIDSAAELERALKAEDKEPASPPSADTVALTASSRHAKQQAFPFHQDSPARRYDPAAMMRRRWRCVPHPSASVHVCVGLVTCRCQTVLKRETVIRW